MGPMRKALFCLAACSALGGPATARAQDWIASVFPDRAHDFGTVARGSKVRHAFRVVNTTNQDIHILDSKTKCGCTDVRIGARDVPPGTQTVIEAVLDTTKFVGYKPSGLTLVIDRPVYTEVDLNLTCFIRGDVTLSPGVADFGVVARGAKRPVTLTLNYAGGMPDWDVTRMQTISSHVTAQLQQLGRSGGSARYQITATLKPSAPSGYFKDEITLQTNDPSSPNIPISVVANIQAAVTVSPSIINLGHVRAGETIQKRVVVRSAQPFRVIDVKARKDGLSVDRLPESQNLFHALTVSLKAPPEAGPYNSSLEITTDLKDEPPARLTAFATIVR